MQYTKADLSTDPMDLLARWDSNMPIYSISTGGLGPGYEQAIQIAAMEMLRVLVHHHIGDANDSAKLDATIRQHIGNRLDGLGLSGSQYGGAASLAYAFFYMPSADTLSQVPDERIIMIRKHFPVKP